MKGTGTRVPRDRKGSTLDAWLKWQEQLHPVEIDLGLERVRSVAERMLPGELPFRAMTVGGTNGKGSCVAFLESILRTAGLEVGSFTSPHLCRYNERIRVRGRPVGDAEIIRAFEEVDAARQGVSLTYFEFSALAALKVFSRSRLEFVLLEVGMGGRLDAVNVVDAEVAVITSIGADHQAWLGHDREQIAREKAGILRPDRPAVYGDTDVPRSLRRHAEALGTRLLCLGQDFHYLDRGECWEWRGQATRYDDLPPPALLGDVQLRNAASALAALEQLSPAPRLTREQLAQGLRDVTLPGRFQVISGPVDWILDVAHNADAAQVLAVNLRQQPIAGRTVAVCGVLGDKDVEAIARAMEPHIQQWIATGLDSPRALAASELAKRLEAVVSAPVMREESLLNALSVAKNLTRPGDRVILFGSFLLVGPVLEHHGLYCAA